MNDYIELKDIAKDRRKAKIMGVFTTIKRGLTPPKTAKQAQRTPVSSTTKAPSGGRKAFNTILDIAERYNANVAAQEPKRKGKGKPMRAVSNDFNDFYWR